MHDHMLRTFQNITGLILAFHIIMFSAGVNLVQYYCEGCDNPHNQVIFPPEHLVHQHQDGNCSPLIHAHNHKQQHEHPQQPHPRKLQIDNLIFTPSIIAKISLPVITFLNHVHPTEINVKNTSGFLAQSRSTKPINPPDILSLTNVLLL
ncbi:MAG: hypothetical protein R6U19_04330 [Bacteroidales bacterium]